MNWKKYGFEFLSIFIAVISAFALNNWNEHRRNNEVETKMLIEIRNGLEKDLDDINENMNGHEFSKRACNFVRKIINGEVVNTDSLIAYYFEFTRDYVAIQNISGYESLKSKGLEFVKNDSLRYKIITLYEYEYETIRKLEEDYYEMQFYANYFEKINQVIAPNLLFDDRGNIAGINLPIQLEEKEKALQKSYLWKIQANRNFILYLYQKIESKIKQLKVDIDRELG